MGGLSSCELNDKGNMFSMQKKANMFQRFTQNIELKRHKTVWTEFVWLLFRTTVRLCKIGIFFVFNKTGSIYWFAIEESLFYIFTLCFMHRLLQIILQLTVT